jgi:hypothetical protein
MRSTTQAFVILAALALLPADGAAQERAAVSSRSYRGHASDRDIENFVAEYRRTTGSRLDDCQTCHRGGAFTETRGGRTVTKNPCDYCHLIENPATGYVEPLPANRRATSGTDDSSARYFSTCRRKVSRSCAVQPLW